jgi:hypothetical protein
MLTKFEIHGMGFRIDMEKFRKRVGNRTREQLLREVTSPQV